MKQVEFTFFVERNGKNVELTVKGEFVPGCEGSTDGKHGPKIEPDEEATVDIYSAIDKDGNEVELVGDEYREAVKAGMEELADMDEGYEDFDDGPDYDYYD